MSRDPIPTWCFALCVVRKGDRFLAVHERIEGQRWYLPAGRVERGESFFDAARRETLEEAGVPIELTGILKVEHTPNPDGARMRVVFVARPIDDTPPKSVPDSESLEARWVTLEELAQLPLRAPRVMQLFKAVRDGAPIHPLDLLAPEA